MGGTVSAMQIPADTVSLRDYEYRFHERVDPAIRAYIAGAAADAITLPGVVHMLTLLQTELEVAMALLGRPALRDLDTSMLLSRTA